ncbi:MAG: glycosyl hydrolase, partial [Actinomycetota bacterium]|nr:glycosyl hydrolase [Actinomycetota bacterium]
MFSLRRLAVLAATLTCGLAAGPAHAAAPGLNIANYDDAPAALDQGAKQVRFFVRWSDFEPDGADDFSALGGPVKSPFYANGLQRNVSRVLAAGATPIMVVLGAPRWAVAPSGTRPRNPDEYAAFIGELAQFLAAKRKLGEPSPVYEVWNEPDSPDFWGEAPSPDFYTAMLKASFARIKLGDPLATVLVGPTTGNNYAWIESLYARGAKGSFDGVAVHTDTACSVVGPDKFYRDPNGRLGQYTFLGYREVRATMLANGDPKPIWMTELGWSTTHGGPTSCTRGASAGKKPSGVDEAAQAAFLTQAFRCMANDPYVVAATWFTLRDIQEEPFSSEVGNYGLLRRDGSAKPALGAFGGAAAQSAGA